MTPVTFDSFRDTHPPTRTKADFPARSRSGLDHTKKRSNMTPVTFDSFRDTHPPARTNANVPARSRSGLDREKEVKYDTRHI